jgi:RimJ/RimL family protein N-acetyltransferase
MSLGGRGSIPMHEVVLEVVTRDEEAAKLIMSWRNDPGTLAMFYHRDPKVWPDFWDEFHDTYFNAPFGLMPLFACVDGKRVAFLKFGMADNPALPENTCDISINISPSDRGRGFAAPILLGVQRHVAGTGVSGIFAEVRRENMASAKSFLRAGFQELDTEEKMIVDTGEIASIRRFYWSSL